MTSYDEAVVYVDRAVDGRWATCSEGAPRAGSTVLPNPLHKALNRAAVGHELAPHLVASAFDACCDLMPPARDIALGSLLMAVMANGPRADHVEALVVQALAADIPRPAERVDGDGPVLVLAGSGKKGTKTPNITTPAALIAAAAGANVIKVGSAGTSSVMGSRDLACALGIQEQRSAPEIRGALAMSGFAFVAVEPLIPRFDAVYGGRFHAVNPFSFGFPLLASPVRGDVAMFGLSHPAVGVAARVLSTFGIEAVDVVATQVSEGVYVDEILPGGSIHSCRVRDGQPAPVVTEGPHAEFSPDALAGLKQPDNAAEAVDRIIDLLDGGGMGAHRTVVAANAAHMLVLTGVAATPPEGRDLALDVLDSGTALAVAGSAPSTPAQIA